MFGDSLDRNEMLDMLNDLKQCKIPFQCAHGRPSVAPIVDLTKLSIETPCKKINFSKLKLRK